MGAHYWLPISTPGTGRGAGTRHAFRGSAWDGRPVGVTVCAIRVPMSQASQMDWIFQPTCQACWDRLISERY